MRTNAESLCPLTTCCAPAAVQMWCPRSCPEGPHVSEEETDMEGGVGFTHCLQDTKYSELSSKPMASPLLILRLGYMSTRSSVVDPNTTLSSVRFSHRPPVPHVLCDQRRETLVALKSVMIKFMCKLLDSDLVEKQWIWI